MAAHKTPDTSLDLLVFRYRNGIRLIKPNDRLPNLGNTGLTLQDLLNLPMNAYLMNAEGRYISANEEIAAAVQAESAHNVVGKTTTHFCTAQTAAPLIENDRRTLQEGKLQILDESADRTSDQQFIQALSIKVPIYENNRVSGLLGLAIIYGMHPVAQALSKIAILGFLEQQQFIAAFDNKCALSDREIDMLDLLARGHSAKSISIFYNISNRTVEHHIENIKRKLNVGSKQELLKVLEKIQRETLK